MSRAKSGLQVESPSLARARVKSTVATFRASGIFVNGGELLESAFVQEFGARACAKSTVAIAEPFTAVHDDAIVFENEIAGKILLIGHEDRSRRFLLDDRLVEERDLPQGTKHGSLLTAANAKARAAADAGAVGMIFVNISNWGIQQ